MKVPHEYMERFEKLAQGMEYGEVTLTLFLKQGRPRFEVGYKESFLPATGFQERDKEEADNG